MSVDEIFAFTDNCCMADTVANLGAVNLTAMTPIMTAVPADDIETNDTTMTTMPANF